MITIKQLADELKVSKQAIRKRINQLPPTDISIGNNRTILINDKAAQKIRESINQPTTNTTTNRTPEVDTLIAMLQKELDSKNATIASQHRQLEQAQKSIQELTAALSSAQLSAQQAQTLHAGTMQKQLQEKNGSVQDVGEDPSQKHVPDPHEEKKTSFLSRIFGRR